MKMTENEKAVYDALYARCQHCFFDTKVKYPGCLRVAMENNPPEPSDVVGFVTSEGCTSCNYCHRVGEISGIYSRTLDRSDAYN